MPTHPSVVMIGLRASFLRFFIEPELAAEADSGAVVGSACGVDCAGGSAEDVEPFIVGGRGGDGRCKRGERRKCDARGDNAHTKVWS
jgi:hypothetical protein